MSKKTLPEAIRPLGEGAVCYTASLPWLTHPMAGSGTNLFTQPGQGARVGSTEARPAVFSYSWHLKSPGPPQDPQESQQKSRCFFPTSDLS